MPKIGQRSEDGKGKLFLGWALYCAYEDFTHDPWPTYAEARAHVEYTDHHGKFCPQGEHEIVEVWKQSRTGVLLGQHFPEDLDIADLLSWAHSEGIIQV